MMRKLHTTQSLMQLTISGYVLIFGLAQLIIGPISDQAGRKKVMLIGTLIYLFGMIFCIFSSNITMLIIARTITAIGAACMSVVAYAIVRDVYSEKELPKIYSYFNCILAVSPILAPIIGGALEELWGWQSIFVFLTLLGIWSLFLATFIINETLLSTQRTQLNRNIFSRYIHILKNPTFTKYTLAGALAMSTCVTFVSLMPYILIGLLNLRPEVMGMFLGASGITYFIGSFVSAHIVNKLGISTTVSVGILGQIITGIIAIIAYKLVGLNLLIFAIPGGILMFFVPFVMGPAAGGAMAPFANIAGSAASMFNAMQWGLTSIISAITLLWRVTSTLSFGIETTLVSLLALSLFILFSKLQTTYSKTSFNKS